MSSISSGWKRVELQLGVILFNTAKQTPGENNIQLKLSVNVFIESQRFGIVAAFFPLFEFTAVNLTLECERAWMIPDFSIICHRLNAKGEVTATICHSPIRGKPLLLGESGFQRCLKQSSITKLVRSRWFQGKLIQEAGWVRDKNDFLKSSKGERFQQLMTFINCVTGAFVIYSRAHGSANKHGQSFPPPVCKYITPTH